MNRKPARVVSAVADRFVDSQEQPTVGGSLKLVPLTDRENVQGLVVIEAEESTDKLPHRDMAVVLISETFGS